MLRRRSAAALFPVVLAAAALAIAPAAASAAPACPADPTFTIAAGDALNFTGTCTGTPLPTYTITVSPANGSVAFVGDGTTAIYTPAVGFSGTDSFTYQASDGTGSTTRTVTIVVLAPGAGGLPPSCPDPATVFVPLGATIRLIGPCRDPEGVALTYNVGNPFLPQSTYNPLGLAQPTKGTFNWGTVVPNVSIDYQHNASNGYADDSFEYSASDGVTILRFGVAIKITDPTAPTPVYATGTDATPADPFIASIQTSAAGAGAAVAVRDPSTPPPAGYFFFGQEYNIQAAAQTVADPLRITFTIDASLVPQGDSVEIFRNGALVDACTAAPSATPDPCVESRGFLSGSGDYRIVVLTSQASVWNVGTSENYPFSGFLSPVDNVPVVNTMKAGRAVPVKFSLGADEGLGILAAGSPSSRGVACASGGTDEVESTLADSASGLQYDPLTTTYTYVWKTSSAWKGTCRRLTVALDDGTSHEAVFAFR